jgi:Ca2+-binding RTX toxin-like protein
MTAGTGTKIEYFNQDDEKIMEITGLSVPLTLFSAFYSKDFNAFGRYLQAQQMTVEGVDNLTDPQFDDFDDIQTGIRNDIVRGRDGRDFISDFGGADKYYGGGGNDVINYRAFNSDPTLGLLQGIKADLKANEIVGPDGYTDKVFSIERVYGTNLDDEFLGNGANNRFRGLAGDDLLNGRKGYDEAEYRRDANEGGELGIRADMRKGEVRDGFGTTDTLISIEQIDATNFRDVFQDSKKAMTYLGRDGNDKFVIRGGNDYMEGGSGADEFIFLGAFKNDIISDFNSGEGDTIEIRNANSFADLGILNNAQNNAVVTFSGNTVTLEGVDAASLQESDFIF